MNITLSLAPLVSLIAGVLILIVLIVLRLLNYIVAAYLIVVGLLGLFGDIHLRWIGLARASAPGALASSEDRRCRSPMAFQS